MLEIGIAAKKALYNLQETIANLYESPKIKHKIKEANLLEVQTLFRFYDDCIFAVYNNNKAKLKRLSDLELDTILVEDYLDKNLLRLLVRYSEKCYSKE